MTRASRLVGAALACWAVLAGAGLGQAQTNTTAVTPDTGKVSDHARRAKSILGSKVSIKGGQDVGTVEDIVFSKGGQIEYLVVSSHGKNVLVPWQAATYNYPQHVATVNITPERWRQVPTFTQQNWPNVYEPAYRQRLYGYYGLTPGQERRIERREGVPPRRR